MKIKFLKDHLDNKAGSEIDLPEGRANYLIRMKVAEPAKEKKIVPAVKIETKQLPKPEKVEMHGFAGPEKIEFQKKGKGEKEKVKGEKKKSK